MMKYYWGEPDIPVEDFIDAKIGHEILEIVKQEKLSNDDYFKIGTYLANFCNWCSYADFLVKYFNQTVSNYLLL